jgi:hypothetical protein
MKAKTGFRDGFTLAEMVMSVSIFLLILSSLVLIYGSSYRHVFTGLKENIAKNNVDVAMASVRSDLIMATRLDSPSTGQDTLRSSLALAGAYNISPDGFKMSTTSTTGWFMYCVKPTVDDGSDLSSSNTGDLYYYRVVYDAATVSTAPIVGTASARFTPSGYTVPACGSDLPPLIGGTIVWNAEKQLEGLTSAYFMVSAQDNIGDVRVYLEVNDQSNATRPVEAKAETVIRYNVSSQEDRYYD